MQVGIVGTGAMGSALAEAWERAGHEILVAGRTPERAGAVAGRLGPRVRAVPISRAVAESDAVLLAVAWDGLGDALAGAPVDAYAGRTVIDCTNAVDYATGAHRLATGSAAETVARLAPRAHVAKALHLFAGADWLAPTAPGAAPRVVAICGDDAASLEVVAALVRDLGAVPAVVGGLDAARQLEEAAGFVMRVVAAGHDPAAAVPQVDARGGA